MKTVLIVAGVYVGIGLVLKIRNQDPQLSSILTWPLALIPVGM